MAAAAAGCRELLLVHQLLLLDAAPQRGRSRAAAADAVAAALDLPKCRLAARRSAGARGPNADSAVALLVGARGPGEQGPEEGPRRLQLRVHSRLAGLLPPGALRSRLQTANPPGLRMLLQRCDRGSAPPAAAAAAAGRGGVRIKRLARRPRRDLVEPAPGEQLVRAGSRRFVGPAHPELILPARTEIQVDVLLLPKRVRASSGKTGTARSPHLRAAVLGRRSRAHWGGSQEAIQAVACSDGPNGGQGGRRVNRGVEERWEGGSVRSLKKNYGLWQDREESKKTEWEVGVALLSRRLIDSRDCLVHLCSLTPEI